MDSVMDGIMDARRVALEKWLAKNEVSMEDLSTTHGIDITVLPNGDEKVTLYKKETVDTVVISYKVGYGREE